MRMAREIVTRTIDGDEFLARPRGFTRERPEITHLTLDQRQPRAQGELLVAHLPCRNRSPAAASLDASLPVEGRSSEAENAFTTARDLRQPVYSRPFADACGTPVFQVHVPLIDRSAFTGTLVAEYSVEALLRYFVPSEVSQRHAISVIDARDAALASTVTPMPGQPPRRRRSCTTCRSRRRGNGLMLRGQGYRTSVGLIGNTLFWMVVALSG